MKAGENQEQQKEPTEPAPSTGAAIRMELAGANPAPTMEGINEQPGRSNYFLGRDPAKWHVTISTTAAASLWPMVHFDLPTQLPVTSLWWNSLWSLLGLAIAGLATLRLLGTIPYRAPAMLAGIVFAFLLMTGGGGANVTAPPPPPPLINTPLGTHTITVTASSGSFTQSFDVTLDVQ